MHWRPSAKVNWQREAEALREVLRSGSSLRTPILVGSASLSEGLLVGASEWRFGLSWEITDFKKEAGLGLVGGSFTVVICNVIGEVNGGQWGTMWITTELWKTVYQVNFISFRSLVNYLFL